MRMKVLEGMLGKKGMTNPFLKVHDNAKSAAQKLVEKHKEELKKKALGLFQGLHDTFTRLYTTEESNAPEAKAVRQQLRSQIPDFKAKLAQCDRLLQEIH